MRLSNRNRHSGGLSSRNSGRIPSGLLDRHARRFCSRSRWNCQRTFNQLETLALGTFRFALRTLAFALGTFSMRRGVPRRPRVGVQCHPRVPH